MSNVNEGVGVEIKADGSSGLTFETPFHALRLAEALYDQARKSLLLRQVLIVDNNDSRHGQTGYINAVERDTLHVKVFVTFPESDVAQPYNAGQLKFEGKGIREFD